MRRGRSRGGRRQRARSCTVAGQTASFGLEKTELEALGGLRRGGCSQLPERAEILPRPTGDAQRESRAVEHDLAGCEHEAPVQLEVRVTGRALHEVVVARKHRGTDALLEFRA